MITSTTLKGVRSAAVQTIALSAEFARMNYQLDRGEG